MQLLMQIKIKKLHENAIFPSYAKPGDAGMDLYAVDLEYTDNYVEYKTGLAVEIPEGYVGLIFPRSSNSKKDLLLCNSTAVIDSGYRGELLLRYKIVYNNHSDVSPYPVVYKIGDACGQLMIIPYPKVQFVEAAELSDTERGEGGFGSTGA